MLSCDAFRLRYSKNVRVEGVMMSLLMVADVEGDQNQMEVVGLFWIHLRAE